MKRRAGPNPIRIVVQGLAPSWIGLALISTPWSMRKASSPGPTNDGSVVAKSVTAWGAPGDAAPRPPVARGAPPLDAVPGPAGGYATGVLKRPVMASPRLWIAWTLPLATCSLNSVYGTVVGPAGPGSRYRATTKFTSSASRNQSHMRRGGMGAGPGPRGPPGRSPGRTRPPGPGPSVRRPCWPGELTGLPSGPAPGRRLSPPDRPSTSEPRHAGAGIEQGTPATARPPVAIGGRGRFRDQARSLRGRNSSNAGSSRWANPDPRGPTRRSRLRHSAVVVGAVCAGPTPGGEGDAASGRPGNALAAACRSLAHRSKALGRRVESLRAGAGDRPGVGAGMGGRRRRGRATGSSPGRAVRAGERTPDREDASHD